jgi:hypothetical protein
VFTCFVDLAGSNLNNIPNLFPKFHPNPLRNESTHVGKDVHLSTYVYILLTNQGKPPNKFRKFNKLPSGSPHLHTGTRSHDGRRTQYSHIHTDCAVRSDVGVCSWLFIVNGALSIDIIGDNGIDSKDTVSDDRIDPTVTESDDRIDASDVVYEDINATILAQT